MRSHIHARRQRVLLDERAARLDFVAHEFVEDGVGLVDLLDADLSSERALVSSVVSQSWLGFISPRPL